MNARFMSILVIASMAGAPVLAKPADQSKVQGTAQLKQALGAVASVASAQGPDQFDSKKNENSQGAEHANPRAILKVCSKDTPAAQRAAICQTGVSPD